MKIAEVMNGNPVYVNHQATVAEAARLMRDNDIGFVPVEQDDKMVGMLTDRDISIRVVADARDPEQTMAGDVMTAAVHFAIDDQDVTEARRLMEKERIRRLPVVNRDKRLVGIVALSDLTQAEKGTVRAGEVLEEITQ